MKMSNFWSSVCKPQNILVIFCLFWGLILIALNPPFQVPDESEHFFKVYGFTEGSLNFKKLQGKTGQILPSNLTLIASHYERLRFKSSAKADKKEILEDLKLPLEKNKKSFYEHNPTSYTPVSYAGLLPFVILFKLLNIAPLWMMYLLRICSLILYTALMYTAVVITPVKKWLFALLAMLPGSIYIAGGINTDSLVIGSAFIFIAWVLKIALDNDIKTFDKKDYVIFALLTTLMTVCKYPYLMMIFMFFMIPKEKFESQKTRLIFFWSLFLINIIYVGIFFLSIMSLRAGISEFMSSVPVSHNQGDKLSILAHPFSYIVLVKDTMMAYTDKYLNLIVGRFGWMDTNLPGFVLNGYKLLIAFAAIFNVESTSNYCKYVYSLKMKLIGVLIYFSSFIITLTSIYILFNPGPLIEGIQGRYLLPVFPLMCLFFQNRMFRFKYLPFLILTSSMFFMYTAVLTLIKRYYVGQF